MLTFPARTLACALSATPLFSTAAEPLNTSHHIIEDVIVTARKIEENAQATPISLVALSGKNIAQRGFTDISQLESAVAGLRFNASSPISGSSNASEIYLRGVGQSDFLLTTEPGVGVYLDGVYISRSIGSVLSLNDIERTEILRGPQATLYGRNTIGGAINVISKLPEPEIGGSVALTAGNLGHRKFNAMINLPLRNDVLLSRLNITSDERDGYLQRLQTGDDLGRRNTLAARLLITGSWSSDIDVTFSVDGSRARNESVALTGLWSEPRDRFGRGALTDLYNEFVAPQSGDFYDARWLTDETLSTNGTGPSRSDADIWGASLTVSVDHTRYEFRSITAYRDMTATFGRDPDNSPLTIVHTQNDYTHHQLSQEFQWVGNHGSTNIDWVAGVFSFFEEGTDDIAVSLVEGLYEVIGAPFSVNGETSVENVNGAIYGDLNYRLTSALKAGLGLRYSYEKKKATVDLALTDIGQPLINNPSQTTQYDTLSPRFSLDYTLSSSSIAYASATRGFKSGGYTGRYVQPTDNLLPFSPEKLVSYEIGFKSDFQRHGLRLNAAAFYSDYQDIQVLIFDGVAPQTRNAADGSIIGFEIESTYLHNSNLHIKAGFSFMEAQYDAIETGLNGITVPINKNNRFVKTPRYSGNASMNYTRALHNGYELTAVFDYSYSSKVAHDAINTAELIEGPVHLFNARITLGNTHQRWKATLYGKNLGNKHYLVGGAADKATFGTLGAIFAPPRQWGVTVAFTY